MRARFGAPFDGIEPIEVWDLPVDGLLLQEWRDSPRFAACVAAMACAVRDAPPAHFSPGARALCARIERVHLVGGAASAAFADAITMRGLPCRHSDDPFAAARAGAAHAGGARCVDVGQTTIKIVDGDRAWRVDRDRTRAPFRDGVPPSERDAARATTLSYLAEVIGKGLAPSARALLGLPCERTEQGLPRSCTYAWPDPDPGLVSFLEARTGASIALANDAELAALAARAALPPGPTTLVLTLGFAVGGALIA